MAVFHHVGLMKVLKSQQADNEKENIMTLLSIFELKVGLIGVLCHMSVATLILR